MYMGYYISIHICGWDMDTETFGVMYGRAVKTQQASRTEQHWEQGGGDPRDGQSDRKGQWDTGLETLDEHNRRGGARPTRIMRLK
eukprot:2744823-Pleurochrysis_carterae.AAC.2